MKFNIFETKLGLYQNEDKDFHEQITKETEAYEKKEGRVISNIGGFQSQDIKIEGVFERIIEQLILPNFKAYLQDDYVFTKAELRLDNMWANINYQYSTNIQHCHPHTDFAFVYYCRCEENSGNLVLNHPNPTQGYVEFFSRCWGNKPSPANTILYSLPPEEGRLVFFPANLMHSVEQNLNEKPRISIAGNLSVIVLDH